MKAYLYPHQNPKILAGQMALYREPKPLSCEVNKDPFFNVGLAERQEKWRENSLIGYIKEKEFKARDLVYNKDGRKVRITNINDEGIVHYHYLDYPQRYSISLNIFKQFNSHYFSGQQIDLDGFKWVREVEKDVDWINKQSPKYNKTYIEWQEVKEPEEFEVAFEAGGVNLQTNATINPEHTKFLKGTKSGLILLTEKKQ